MQERGVGCRLSDFARSLSFMAYEGEHLSSVSPFLTLSPCVIVFSDRANDSLSVILAA